MISEKLLKIQTQIKAPKNLYNSFGKYHYRNAEGICEAVKPYLTEQNCALLLEDEIIEVGGRVYVQAYARLIDCETGERICATALARESEEKKGMDASQITGTASSYARKYALNGLFLLDDTKDADTDEYANQNAGKSNSKNSEEEQDKRKTEALAKEKVSDLYVKALASRCESDGVPESLIHSLYNVKALKDLTNYQYRNINENWERIVEKAKA